MYANIVASLLKGGTPKRYAHIDFVPPKAVRKEAKRGLRLRREHGRGGLSNKQASEHGIGSGVQRASDLASDGKVSPRTVKRMRAFFARHSAYKEHHSDKTSPAYISWLLWGGDAGQRWANKVYAQMERADEQMKKAREGAVKQGHKWDSRRRVVRRGKLSWDYKYRNKRGKGRRGERGEKNRYPRKERTSISDSLLERVVTTPLSADWREAEVAESLPTNAPIHEDTFTALSESVSSGEQESVAVSEEVAAQLSAVGTDIEETSPPLSGIVQQTVATDTPQEERRESDDPTPEESATEESATEESATEESATEEAPPQEEAEAERRRTLLLPIKPTERAGVLTAVMIATETYKVLNVGNPDALGVEAADSFAKEKMSELDASDRKKAREAIRESLNKDREEAKARKEEARAKERQEKEEARAKEQERREKLGQEAFERELQFRREERELAQADKEKRKVALEERKEKRKVALEERKEKRKVALEERREARKEKEAERKEKQRVAREERREEQRVAREERRKQAKKTRKKVPKRQPKKRAQ